MNVLIGISYKFRCAVPFYEFYRRVDEISEVIFRIYIKCTVFEGHGTLNLHGFTKN